MTITGCVWQALTHSERMAVLRYASMQNLMRWNKRKARLAERT